MRFKRPSTTDIDMGTNIVNLIDVLLLLLIFFMLTTTFSKSTRLTVKLPEASAQPAPPQDKRIDIVITADSHYSVNDRIVSRSDIDTLKAALNEASGGDNSLPLTIMADANTPNQAVVRAMDAAGQLGFKQLSLATQTPDGER